MGVNHCAIAARQQQVPLEYQRSTAMEEDEEEEIEQEEEKRVE